MLFFLLNNKTNLNMYIFFSRSPDDFHHRINQSRTAVESPSVHFQRVEAHNHHVLLKFIFSFTNYFSVSC